jgi:anti-sigma factor RsiW
MRPRNDHERAQEIAASLPTADGEERAFLQGHLAACPGCAAAAAAMEQGRVGLRFVSAPPDPVLVATTQRRVRERAAVLREEQVRRRGLALSCVLAASMTLATGLLLWRTLDGLAGAVNPWVWVPSFVSLWFLPGVLAGAAAWAAGALLSSDREASTARRSALTP